MDELSKLTVSKLKERLRSLGIATSGRKSVLLERLRQAQLSSNEDEAMQAAIQASLADASTIQQAGKGSSSPKAESKSRSRPRQIHQKRKRRKIDIEYEMSDSESSSDSDKKGASEKRVIFEEPDSWRRGTERHISADVDDLCFMILDVTSKGPNISIFGVFESGTTLQVVVNGFYPYFFIPANPNLDDSKLEEIKQKLNGKINGQKHKNPKKKRRKKRDVSEMDDETDDESDWDAKTEEFVLDVEFIRAKSLMYYRGPDCMKFLKITTKLPSLKATCIELLSTSQFRQYVGSTMPYEANVPHVVRFMVDSFIVGGGWATLPAGRYGVDEMLTADDAPAPKVQIKVSTEWIAGGIFTETSGSVVSRSTQNVPRQELSSLSPKPSEPTSSSSTGALPSSSSSVSPSRNFQPNQSGTDLEKIHELCPIASLRVLGVSLLCLNPRTRSLDVKIDPVFSISCSVRWLPSNSDSKENESQFIHQKVVFLLDSHSSTGAHKIDDIQVLKFKSESDLLISWRHFVLRIDPDVVTGFNLTTFDMKYIFDRAEILGILDFCFLGRDSMSTSKIKKIQTYSAAWVKAKKRMAATSNQESAQLMMSGRLVLDMTRIIQTSHSLRTYTVSQICTTFLEAPEEYFDQKTIRKLALSSHASRVKRLIRYGVRQCVTPHLVMGKLMTVVQAFEMARATGINLQHVYTRGQMIRGFNLLLRYSRKLNYLIPNKGSEAGELENGPLVFDPTVLKTTGLHSDPVAVMDFASLYPSLMIAYNISYDTLIHPQDVKKYKKEECHVSPIKRFFVKQDKRVGVLSYILQELIKTRKLVNEILNKTEDSSLRIVLNARQKALKLSTNAVYGFTGSSASKLICSDLAESTVTWGSLSLQKAAEWIRDNCFPFAQTIYGDTDSIMVRLHGWSIPDAINFGHQTGEIISQMFPDPVTLRFEKVYAPFLLQHTKHYAGQKYVSDDTPAEFEMKGFEVVRRDTIPIVAELMNDCLKDIVIGKDTKKAILKTQDCIRKILSGKVSLHDLTVTKGLWRGTSTSDYAMKMAHTELAQRMMARDKGLRISLGERVRYVFIQGHQKARQHELSEDPLFVYMNKLPVDYMLYVTNYVKKPMVRIFELPNVIGNNDGVSDAGDIFQGAHMRTVVQSAVSSGGKQKRLGDFFSAVAKCASCHKVLLKTDKVVCSQCRDSRGLPDIFDEAISKFKKSEILTESLSQRCVSCQFRCTKASVTSPVLCSNTECKTFWNKLQANRLLRDSKNIVRTLQW